VDPNSVIFGFRRWL